MESTRRHRRADNAGPEAARQDLHAWARRQRSVAADRDRFVKNAFKAGLTKEDIHMATGLGRTTINRILAGKEPCI